MPSSPTRPIQVGRAAEPGDADRDVALGTADVQVEVRDVFERSDRGRPHQTHRLAEGDDRRRVIRAAPSRELDGFAAEPFDRRDVAGSQQVARRHPAAADRRHVGVREVRPRCCRARPRRSERTRRSGTVRQSALIMSTPAESVGGEQLHGAQPAAQHRLDVGRRRDARQDVDAARRGRRSMTSRSTPGVITNWAPASTTRFEVIG